MSASLQVPPTLSLLLAGPVPDGRVGARLARWFGRGEAVAPAPLTPRDHAAALAGLPHPVPWAALWCAAFGSHRGGSLADRQWLWLEPVHMEPGMNDIRMHALARPADATALHRLAGLLAPLLEPLGARCEAGPGRLLLRLGTPLQVVCQPPEAAFARALRECLPEGADAAALRRLMTECQMVLHQAGESGVPALDGANAVWPWGEGALPAPRPAGHRGAHLLGNDALLHAAARQLDAGDAAVDAGAGTPASARLLTLLAQPQPGRALILVDQASDSALDEILPAAQAALASGRIAAIEVQLWRHPAASQAHAAIRLRRGRLWQAWRRAQSPWKDADDRA